MMKVYQMHVILTWLLATIIWRPVVSEDIDKNSEIEASEYLKNTNYELERVTNLVMLVQWNYLKNKSITNNAEIEIAASEECENIKSNIWNVTVKYPWSTYTDPNTKRQFELLSDKGIHALPYETYEVYIALQSAMKFASSKAMPYPHNGEKAFNLDIALNASDEATMMKQNWIQRREFINDMVVRDLYAENVELLNEAARSNKYADNADYWTREYGLDDFYLEIERAWEQMKPLYLQLHAYIRRKLWERYGSSVVSRRGLIPVYLFDSTTLRRRWKDFTRPYPTVDDIEQSLFNLAIKKQNYTKHKMFKVAEEYFTSMNFSAIPKTFWENPILEKPIDFKHVCDPSSWVPFYDNSQHGSIDFEDFLKAHIDMARIQYYLQYKDQPFLYQNRANKDKYNNLILYTILNGLLSLKLDLHIIEIS